MNTPAHLIFGLTAFGKAHQPAITAAALAGAIIPDLSLYLLAGYEIALCSAVLLHLVLDFGFHHDDGRAHFWPITNWIFESPVSYWDPRHYGTLVGGLEVFVALLCCVVLWRRFTGRWMRGVIVALGLAETAPGLFFALMFAG